jgi:hypothetical protein
MDTKEKLVELVNGVLKYLPYGEISSHTANDIANRLISNGVIAQEWISVEDRLPEEDGTYLVYKAKINVRDVLGFVEDGIEVDEEDLNGLKNIWFAYDSEWGYYPVNTVTHWMPLPEPPKGE